MRGRTCSNPSGVRGSWLSIPCYFFWRASLIGGHCLSSSCFEIQLVPAEGELLGGTPGTRIEVFDGRDPKDGGAKTRQRIFIGPSIFRDRIDDFGAEEFLGAFKPLTLSIPAEELGDCGFGRRDS